MMEIDKIADAQHRKLAVDLFNYTWTFLRKPDRTDEDIDEMINAVHSSRYHWGKYSGCTPQRLAVGEWQISHVYAILGMPKPALWHAQRSLFHAEGHLNVDDWVLASCHEAMARASALNGDDVGFNKHYFLAMEVADKIGNDEDKAIVLNDLASEPWFGFDYNLASEREAIAG
jgi:hypothetical protein